MITGRAGTDRILATAATFTAKYRDGQGIVRETATGCRDQQAALSRLAELERRVELVKAHVITPAEKNREGLHQILHHTRADRAHPGHLLTIRRRVGSPQASDQPSP